MRPGNNLMRYVTSSSHLSVSILCLNLGHITSWGQVILDRHTHIVCRDPGRIEITDDRDRNRCCTAQGWGSSITSLDTELVTEVGQMRNWPLTTLGAKWNWIFTTIPVWYTYSVKVPWYDNKVATFRYIFSMFQVKVRSITSCDVHNHYVSQWTEQLLSSEEAQVTGSILLKFGTGIKS